MSGGFFLVKALKPTCTAGLLQEMGRFVGGFGGGVIFVLKVRSQNRMGWGVTREQTNKK